MSNGAPLRRDFPLPAIGLPATFAAMFASLLLLLVAIVYRVVLGVTGSAHLDWWHNFSPLAAIALCGAIYLPRRLAIALPLVALFVSDLFLNAHYAEPLLTLEILPRYFALGLCVALGLAVRRQPALPRVLGASLVGSVAFYLITNTASWIAEPLYTKTAAGWWQALVSGLPGYPPTLVFFRNSLCSDLFFTLLFATCMALAQMKPAVSAKVHEAV
jgi:hypothetical protein